MRARPRPEDLRALARMPHAAALAQRLRDMARLPGSHVEWRMPNAEAEALADILERGADAVDAITAQIKAQDVQLDEAKRRSVASKARLDSAMAFRRRSLLIAVPCLMLVGTWAAVQLTLFLLKVIGNA
jgi:hypothetical protein